MYISKRIDNIFQEVKQRFKRTHSKTSGSSIHDNDVSTKTASSDDNLPKPSKKKSNNSWILWTVGTVIVGVAVAAFLLLPEKDKKQPENVGP